jgi:hypothetical protein
MNWTPDKKEVLRWILLCALAEVLGIAAGAFWYSTIDELFGTPQDFVQRLPVWFLLALSGLLEGAILGSMQAWGLVRIYPNLSVGRWINVTILLAIAGWALGAAIPTFMAPAFAGGGGGEPTLSATLAFAAIFGLIVGALFGAIQYGVLRTAAFNASRWIPANAIGWAIGLPIVYWAATTTPEGVGTAEILMRGLWSGALAGLAIGLCTAAAFWLMPAIPDANPAPAT